MAVTVCAAPPAPVTGESYSNIRRGCVNVDDPQEKHLRNGEDQQISIISASVATHGVITGW